MSLPASSVVSSARHTDRGALALSAFDVTAFSVCPESEILDWLISGALPINGTVMAALCGEISSPTKSTGDSIRALRLFLHNRKTITKTKTTTPATTPPIIAPRFVEEACASPPSLLEPEVEEANALVLPDVDKLPVVDELDVVAGQFVRLA